FRRDRTVSVPLDNLSLAQFAGNDDDIVFGTQTAGPNVLVEDIRERKLVILENEPRPTFVHRRDVTFIETDPRRDQLISLDIEPIIYRDEIHRQLARNRLQLGFDSAAAVNDHRSRGIPLVPNREWL